RELVRDPVREQARLGPFEHLLRDAVHLVLDATARDGPGQLAAGGDAELRAGRPRRRTPRGDDGGERESLAASAPPFEISEDLLHAPCIIAGAGGAAQGLTRSSTPRGRCSECVRDRCPLPEALRNELAPLFLAPAVE